MFGLLSGLKKELLLVARRPKDLLLIVIFPLLIILAFGGMYSGNLTQTFSVALWADESNISLGANDSNNPFNQPINFYDEFVKLGSLSIIKTDSEEKVREMVLSNKADLGIIIKRNTADSPYSMNIIIDSTDFVQAALIRGIMGYQINAMATNISTAMLEKVYSRILLQEESVNKQKTNIDSFLQEIQRIKQVTNMMDLNNTSIDVSSVRATLRNQIDILKSLNSEVEKNKTTSDEIITDIDLMTSLTYDALNSGSKTVDGSGRTVYAPPGNQIDGIMQNIPDSIKYKVNSQRDSFASTSSKMSVLINDAEVLDQNIATSGEYVLQLKDFIKRSKDVQNEIENNMIESKQLLSELSTVIANLKQYSPQFLAKPVQLNFIDITKTPNIATQFLAVVFSLVIMLTGMFFASLSVIREKKQGLEKRLKMMPVSKLSLVLEKILGAFILLGIIIFAMVFIGNHFFGIQMNGPILDITVAFALVIICFVSIGLAIGALMSNESNTILVILALAFPMLFLSGILVPVELMLPGAQLFNFINPLYSSIVLLTNVGLKGISISYSTNLVISLLATTFTALAIAYKKYF